ncbi:Spy/CpxP family protein refolding chaperone [Pseudomonas sp. BIGb0408]|uniref:Spy/CpxP family protein refolding chaperone n=1 Tax=Phytopseudomonas flavescens TaxID=29435 RepID=A0A7Y9XN98_9GAMM|nr:MULTISPECIES: Spy/CpxP family protein refolding chaperone [Pseudomonas]MCW2292169.1 Spy/CpxP family protein refolding chaperone [Pseudomonas sp. BIGb0408]NYH73259.1 Spy/CpxP family protein refolding chaperone [Pseudomonas flavescens]
MRKTMTALLLAMTLPTLAMAAPGGDHRPGADHGPRFFHELDLSKDQQRQVHKLMGEQRKNYRELTQRYLDKLPAADKQALETERKASRDKQQSAIRALLTPEQQKTFDEQAAKMKERKADREAFEAWKAEHKKAG